MHIEDLKGVGEGEKENENGLSDCRRVLVGAGACALFYPTLVYDVVRNKFQAEFRWWDQIHEFLLLGVVPFPRDVKRLKELGVRGVITMNEPYETLVPHILIQSSWYSSFVLPTRDYLFAPSIHDICQAVNFIHGIETSLWTRQHGSRTHQFHRITTIIDNLMDGHFGPGSVLKSLYHS